MRLQLVDDHESTPITLPTAVQLVAPDERLTTWYGDTALYYRRLPLRVAAQHPNDWSPLAYCLLGWDGAVDGQGQPLAFAPALIDRLPGEVGELLGPLRGEANPHGRPGQATVTVRRLPSAQYQALFKSSQRRGELHLAVLMLRVLEYGVLGWHGAVLDAHGQPVPYDRERLGYLPDETVARLWTVLGAGEAPVEAALGNSARSSTGSDC